MAADLMIREVKILLEEGLVERNIVVDGGKIVGIEGEGGEGDLVYEGGHKIAIPGCIDLHVHFRDPSPNGAEDFESGSLAAAHGGITTVVDMPNTSPPVVDGKTFDEKVRIASKRSYIDFGLYGGTGAGSLGNASELVRAGALGIKTFMTYGPEELSSTSTEELREAMVDVSRAGVPLLIHAEDLGASELMGMRPPICESVAIARALELARQLKARVHICHLTSKEGLQVLKAFRSLGSKATAETAPHYLGLTKEEIERRGPYAKVEPPLRTREDNEALLSGLRREIDLIASDHAPHPKEEKDRMDLAPPGTTGVETTLPFLLDLSDKGALSLHDIVRLLCTGPAKLLGLSPRKGSLAIGSDADITIIDPKKKFDVCPQNLLTRTHDSIFLGRSFQGSPVATFSRGELIIENGEVMAKPGRGRFLSSQRARA